MMTSVMICFLDQNPTEGVINWSCIKRC